MKKVLLALGVCMFAHAHAQVSTHQIYVCTDSNGAVRLNNIKPAQNCAVRTFSVRSTKMNDPMPASGALIVSKNVQAQRDVSRTMILQSELSAAQQSLAALQAQYEMSQNSVLKNQMQAAQANINALQREISREF